MRTTVLTAILAMLLLTSVGRAEERRVPLIGVVKIQRIFKDYKYAKDMEESIKQELKTEKEEIDSLNKQIEKKKQDLTHDPLKRAGTTPWKLDMVEIERLKVLLDDKVGRSRKITQNRMAEFYRTVYEHFRKAIELYGSHHKFDMIITAPDPELAKPEDEDAQSPQAIQNEILLRRVQFVSGSTDITEPILTLMNQRYDKWVAGGRVGSP